MIIQTTKIRKLFNKSGIQVSEDAMDMINRDYEKQIERMIANVQWCNVKRLNDLTYWSIYRRDRMKADAT